MLCKSSISSLICLFASAVGTALGMMLFFKNTRKGRRMAKKAKRLGKDTRDLFSF